MVSERLDVTYLGMGTFLALSWSDARPAIFPLGQIFSLSIDVVPGVLLLLCRTEVCCKI